MKYIFYSQIKLIRVLFIVCLTVIAVDAKAKAISVLYPTTGNDVKGVVQFTEVPGGVLITAQLSGLSPGKHGFHIHEYGDCSGADGKTAGGHFNPHGKHHSGPNKPERHVGDLGNILADKEGNATYTRVDTHVTIESIIGKSLIVHAKEDDLTSQPTGAAGPRVACGVIGIAKE
ncbi:MAG: superoxide dismutase family protein [Kiritimatiellae bacterium]|nr:superoxide dismutase family protein [Kiritimatiellia bacterium]